MQHFEKIISYFRGAEGHEVASEFDLDLLGTTPKGLGKDDSMSEPFGDVCVDPRDADVMNLSDLTTHP